MDFINQKQNVDIGAAQLSDKFQQYLKASTYLYTQAKKFSFYQFALTVMIPVALTILNTTYSDKLRVWAAFYGVVVTFLDLAVLETILKQRKKDGASVQEQFDCELLLMDWNETRGDKLDTETIVRAAGSLRRELSPNERNWYPKNVGTIPIFLSRLICQRTNIWWDRTIRQYYRNLLLVLGIVVVLVIAIIGLVQNLSLEDFLLGLLVPMFPAITWLVKEVKKHGESIASLARLMKNANALWDTALKKRGEPDYIALKSRQLQDELFVHRHSNQPVPNFFNKLFGKKLDVSMNKSAEDLIREAKAARLVPSE